MKEAKFEATNPRKRLKSWYDHDFVCRARKQGLISEIEESLMQNNLIEATNGFHSNLNDGMLNQMIELGWYEVRPLPRYEEQSMLAPTHALFVTEAGFEKRRQLFRQFHSWRLIGETVIT